MATFPSYAVIVQGGYSESPDYGVIRSEMDGGLAKQRPRWSKAIVTRDVTIEVVTKANKGLFDAWAKTDLNGGAGWFTWTDPLDDIAKQTRIVGGKYKWGEPLGPIWRAQCQIETIG